MKLLARFNTPYNANVSNFNLVTRIASGAKEAVEQAGNLVKKGTTAVKEGVENVLPAKPVIAEKDVKALKSLSEDAQNYRNGIWGKLAAGGTALSVPMMALPMVSKDANTKALEKMRAEDKARELAGLAPLAATGQLLTERLDRIKNPVATANAVSNTFSQGSQRVVNMAPKYILPGELPPNSL